MSEITWYVINLPKGLGTGFASRYRLQPEQVVKPLYHFVSHCELQTNELLYHCHRHMIEWLKNKSAIGCQTNGIYIKK